MPWYAQQGSGGTPVLRKAASSPGAGWVEIPGTSDSMTEQQAVGVLEQDILHGTFGYTVPNPAAAFTDTAHALTAFYAVITNGKMWRSLGWLALGTGLMTAGVALLVSGELGEQVRLPAADIPLRAGAGPAVPTPAGRAPVIPLVLAGIGGYLAWFGVHYWASDIKWPTDPVKAVLQGNGLPAPTGQQTAAQAATAAEGGSTAVGPAGSAPQEDQGAAYDARSLAALWTSQGGSASTAAEAANVAMAESGGNPRITSPNPDGGTNVGLWQLDTKGVGAGYTVAQLQDPATNARLTVMHTANGTNWSQWADAVVVGGVYVGPGG